MIPTSLLTAELDTPLGQLRVVVGERGVRAVLWPGEDGRRVQRALAPPAMDPARGPGNVGPGAATPVGDPASLPAAILTAALAQLEEYFAGERRSFDLPLDLRGTPFQLRAWQALRLIPYGQTSSYGAQARRIGAPAAVRAVGAANRANPISVIVPCHRVVSAAGQLAGFAGGISAKQWLLGHEKLALGSPGLLH